jgi:aromatic ring hydroxylase
VQAGPQTHTMQEQEGLMVFDEVFVFMIFVFWFFDLLTTQSYAAKEAWPLRLRG